MNQLYRFLVLCSFLLLSFRPASAYDYPFANRYAATVIGTPAEFAVVLPNDIPTRVGTIKMFPHRKVPGVLWNMDELYYSYQRQVGPAPLIFLVAGTGASFKSSKMQLMQKAFYHAGFNVVSLSSPTHPNFITAASTSSVPGNLQEDSADLYTVMKAVWKKLQGKMHVTRFYITGYSLGAAQSAFIARIDEQEKAFNFKKVLMINPPVSLYNSVMILDKLLEENIPGGMDHFNEFYQKVIQAFGETYAHGDKVDFNDQFLYEAYKYKKPQSDEPLQALIGISFRISAENMVFASDVMTKAGYVVPKGCELGRYDHVTPYAKVLSRLTFLDYFRGIFMPHFKALNPNITEKEMVEAMSLRSIEDYLRNSPQIGMIHNEDDVILLPGEIDYLRDVFGTRATIYPHGGHCGNMAYPENVNAMIDFFQATPQH
ncbi:MAG: alpha/beta hydrolase [Desulfobulbus sp.]